MNKDQKRLKKIAFALGVIFSLTLCGYAGWSIYVKDRIVGCTFDIGSAKLEMPDLGQRKYCPDRFSHSQAAIKAT